MIAKQHKTKYELGIEYRFMGDTDVLMCSIFWRIFFPNPLGCRKLDFLFLFLIILPFLNESTRAYLSNELRNMLMQQLKTWLPFLYCHVVVKCYWYYLCFALFCQEKRSYLSIQLLFSFVQDINVWSNFLSSTFPLW